MRELFGSGIEVDIKAGAAVILEVGYEGSAEGGLYDFVRASIVAAADRRIVTLPAPAGPMTRTPNLLMFVTGQLCAGFAWGNEKRQSQSVIHKARKFFSQLGRSVSDSARLKNGRIP